MGYAIAEAASRTGAEVVLISGPTSLRRLRASRRISVVRAEEMLKAVLEELPRADIIIKDRGGGRLPARNGERPENEETG